MPLTISWKEEGRVEGHIEEARKMLLIFGEPRLGVPSARVAERIDQIGSLERLERMAREIAGAETWDDLLSAS